MTKLSIPHEFVQRTAAPNKRAVATPVPTPTSTPEAGGLHHVDSSSSLDSTPQNNIGPLLFKFIF
jgi:hypothetical protein